MKDGCVAGNADVSFPDSITSIFTAMFLMKPILFSLLLLFAAMALPAENYTLGRGGGPLTAITFSRTGDHNWLWVAQGDKLIRRPVKVTGANAWTVVKPPKPTL